MDTGIWTAVGGNIRKYRERARLTQADLAERVGVGTAFISRVERGKKHMKLETMAAIADALDVTVDLLIRERDSRAQTEVLARMLEGCSPEFIDGVIQLVRVSLDNFGPTGKTPQK